jgi:hypothetical protein
MAGRSLVLVLLILCSRGVLAQSPVPLHHELGSVRDQAGNPAGPASPSATPIFEASKHAPINAPDGHQLTLGEFNAAQGAISVKCTGEGTRTILHLWGLVPKGTYSLGLVMMGAMGAGPAAMGAPSDDPKASTFAADQDGQADIAVTKKSGALSGKGSISDCWPADLLNMVMQQPMAQLIGNYHFGRSGSDEEGTFVPQFSFAFPRLMRLNNEIRDRQKKPITDSTPLSTPLFEFRKGNPIFSPRYRPADRRNLRHHITLGEFRQVAGSIAAKCTDQGTHVSMHLNGLIPHGVYTVWVAKPDPTDMSKMIGVGALGKDDGSQNSFSADKDGEAYISATNPGGKLSTFGTIAGCWLTGEPIVQIAGVYHIDGNTHGKEVGPDGMYVGQFAFAYAMMPPPSSAPAAKPGN